MKAFQQYPDSHICWRILLAISFVSLFHQSSSFLQIPNVRRNVIIRSQHPNVVKSTVLRIKSAGIIEDIEINSRTKDDVSKVILHLASCVLVASVLTLWEGIDCTYLKPLSSTIRNYPETTVMSSNDNRQVPGIIQLMAQSTRGMGRGAADRSDGWYQDTYQTSRDSIGQDITSTRTIRSYNEIMLEHRVTRVPNWKKEVVTKEDVMDSVDSVIRALETINLLKSISEEYEWETMTQILREPVLTSELQYSCGVLQQAKDFLSFEMRQEIGFDWGSCAWRLCGAKADAQESLAELYNSIGMFEPFECLFVLDIVDRSLRDILTAVPVDYKPSSVEIIKRIGEYVPYEAKYGGGEDENGIDAMDKDFLNALEGLRSVNFDEED